MRFTLKVKAHNRQRKVKLVCPEVFTSEGLCSNKTPQTSSHGHSKAVRTHKYHTSRQQSHP